MRACKIPIEKDTSIHADIQSVVVQHKRIYLHTYAQTRRDTQTHTERERESEGKQTTALNLVQLHEYRTRTFV